MMLYRLYREHRRYGYDRRDALRLAWWKVRYARG